ncbi:MAG: hypothetical protein IOD12_04200 [Silvanigrellales bacterium]|nr:hypothetical protein [Silvanigrellales bacterium]
MPKRLKNDVEAAEKRLRALRKTSFACLPDLDSAVRAAFNDARYLVFESFTHAVMSAKRGPGRPRKDDHTGETIDSYSLAEVTYKEDKEALRKEELESACFVIATNASVEELSTEKVLCA